MNSDWEAGFLQILFSLRRSQLTNHNSQRVWPFSCSVASAADSLLSKVTFLWASWMVNLAVLGFIIILELYIATLFLVIRYLLDHIEDLHHHH